ncbi:hypothetical protein CSW60_08195 [Caulobacter sp. X]|nr:hypothetical protein [Caulobacter sp. X]PIC01465.1 hypothetical protein CSW60_08195 [Caulobacter sp. X]
MRTSGVDEALNAKTAREIRDLEKRAKTSGATVRWWKRLRIAGFGAIAATLYLAYSQHPAWLAGAAALLVGILFWLNPVIKTASDRADSLAKARAEKEAEAWRQMATLNSLFDWDIFAKLVSKTVPKIELDPYFTNARLTNLHQSYGWSDAFNQGRSVMFAHTGLVSGNPFIMAQTLRHWIGAKTYSGSLTIHWTEVVRDSNGRTNSVSRSQTLRASVTKPFPEYQTESILIYGNQAAPDLSFSRQPSSLSGLDDGLINNWRKSQAIKKLEAKARKLAAGSGFTPMANREFDALFAAGDRDHEVQFRMLFTPLAQQEIVKILKDKAIGFGDNFTFKKIRKINVVEPAHLVGADISAAPEMFRFYDLAVARARFNDYHNALFKAFYFAFAPILAIPLYQQHRPAEDIYAGVIQGSCFWEHEAIANYMGERCFAHPDCITRNVLKTVSQESQNGAQRVNVTAYGYRGDDRVDYISMRGDDGRTHEVPVHWVDYIPVNRTSELLVCHETPASTLATSEEASPQPQSSWRGHFAQHGVSPENAIARRSLFAALIR